jgi:hypothetical protein
MKTIKNYYEDNEELLWIIMKTMKSYYELLWRQWRVIMNYYEDNEELLWRWKLMENYDELLWNDMNYNERVCVIVNFHEF